MAHPRHQRHLQWRGRGDWPNRCGRYRRTAQEGSLVAASGWAVFRVNPPRTRVDRRLSDSTKYLSSGTQSYDLKCECARPLRHCGSSFLVTRFLWMWTPNKRIFYESGECPLRMCSKNACLIMRFSSSGVSMPPLNEHDVVAEGAFAGNHPAHTKGGKQFRQAFWRVMHSNH